MLNFIARFQFDHAIFAAGRVEDLERLDAAGDRQPDDIAWRQGDPLVGDMEAGGAAAGPGFVQQPRRHPARIVGRHHHRDRVTEVRRRGAARARRPL